MQQSGDTKDMSLNKPFAQGAEAPGLQGELSAEYSTYLSEARRRRPEWIGGLSGGFIQ